MRNTVCVALMVLAPGVSAFGASNVGGAVKAAMSDGFPADYPNFEGSEFVGNWAYSLLSPEEQSREPSANERQQACDSSSEAVQARQKLFDAQCELYGYDECLKVADKKLLPEWDTCMGAAKSAEDWKTTVQPTCLGPLADLLGIWVGDNGKSYSPVPVYSPMAEDEKTFLEEGVGLIPGMPSATFHAIKNQTYKEFIQFSPILGNVKNRGYGDNDHINAACGADQVNQGIKYTLTVVQTSPSDADGEYGGILHDETGMFLYNSVPSTGGGELQDFKLFRMGTIPHGVSFTAEGTNAQTVEGDDALDKLVAEQEATYMNIRALPNTCMPDDDYDTTRQDWGSQLDGSPQPGLEPFDDLTPWLVNETKKLQSVKSYTHMVMGTETLSQTKFLKNQAENVDFKFDMWLSDVVGEDGKEYKQLQYTQFVKFIFQQRFDCLDCEGGTKDKDGCYPLGSCDERLDKIFTNPTGKDKYLDIEGLTLNELPAMQHGQCFNCKPDPKCNSDRGGGKMFWPHIQVNTLRKVTPDTDPDILALYDGIDGFGKFDATDASIGGERRRH